MDKTPEELAEASANGDAQAFAALCFICNNVVASIVHKHRNGLQKSELNDCKNEALELLNNKWIPAYLRNQSGDFLPYMYTCAKNMVISKYRENKNKVFDYIAPFEERYVPSLPDHDAFRSFEVSMLNKQLLSAILSLSNADARRATILKVLYSPKDAYVAEMLQVNLNTIKSHYKRGFARMLSHLLKVYNYTAENAAAELGGLFKDVRVDAYELYQKLSNKNAVSIFESISLYDNLLGLCEGVARPREEVIKMIKKGLDDMAHEELSRGKINLSDNEKAEIVLKGFEDTAEGKRKKSKTRSKAATEQQKLEDLGEFLYTMFNKRPDKIEGKSLPEYVEEQMKEQGITAEEMAKKLKLTLVEFSKLVTSRKSMKKKDLQVISNGKTAEVLEEESEVMSAPVPFDEESVVRSSSTEVDEDAEMIMKKIAKFFRRK